MSSLRWPVGLLSAEGDATEEDADRAIMAALRPGGMGALMMVTCSATHSAQMLRMSWCWDPHRSSWPESAGLAGLGGLCLTCERTRNSRESLQARCAL